MSDLPRPLPPIDPDDVDSLRRALLQRDLLIGRLRREIVLAERWAASVAAQARDLMEAVENTQSSLVATLELVPDDLALGSEIDDLRYALGDDDAS